MKLSNIAGKLYQVIEEPWITLQVIPNKAIKNNKLEIAIRALHDLYRRKFDRTSFSNLSFQVEKQFQFNFRIHMTREDVVFFVSIPEEWRIYTEQKLSSIWDKATIIEATWEPYFNPNRTAATTLHLRKHNMFSLDTNIKDPEPLPALLNTVRHLNPDEQAMVDILAEPVSHLQWEYDVTRAYHSFQSGNPPKRLEISWKWLTNTILEFLDSLFREVASSISGFMDSAPRSLSDRRKGRIRYDESDKHISDPEIRLLSIKGLSSSSKQKIQTPTFSTWIRVVAESEDHEIAKFTARTISASFRDINDDNELEMKMVKDKHVQHFLNNIHRRLPHGFLGLSNDRLSTHELAKIMKMPEQQLIEEFPEIVAVHRREVSLPHQLYNPNGIPIGIATEKGKKHQIYVPVSNRDVFCIPHVGVGKMGTGKSTEAINWAVHAIKQGFSTFMVDTSDGKVIEETINALPEDFPEDHIVWLDLSNIEYPIPLSLSDVAIANTSDGDETLERRIVANKLKDALIHFIKNISSYGTDAFSDRMEEYTGAAGKIVLRDPNNSLLELALALVSPAYLEKILSDKTLTKESQAYEILSKLLADYKKNEATARTKVEGILTRLNLLLNNEFAANMFLQRNKLEPDGSPSINFRKWADGDKHPYFVGIYVPKEFYGADSTNRITAFILQKWYLAILSRANIPVKDRKPCLLIWDEPHTAIDASGHVLENMAVELRKYRGKPIFFVHGPRQFGRHWGAITTGGFSLSLYKTKDAGTINDLSNEILPFTPLEAMAQIPDRWGAINKLSAAGESDVPAFLAQMNPPPPKTKDRSYLRDICSKKYGTHYSVVEKDIYERRKVLFENITETTSTMQEVAISRSRRR